MMKKKLAAFVADERGAFSIGQGVIISLMIVVVVAVVGTAQTFSVVTSHKTDAHVSSAIVSHNALVRVRAATMYDTANSIIGTLPSTSSWTQAAPAAVPLAKATPASAHYSIRWQGGVLVVDGSQGTDHVTMTNKIRAEANPPGTTVDTTQ